MNFRFTVLETSLNRAEFRWKWHRFVQRSSVLGIVVGLLLLLLGVSILQGWITDQNLVLALFGVLCAASLVAWMILVIAIMAATLDRRWLASVVERADRRFLDRLHTLLFLEGRRGDQPTESFAVHIARQAQAVLAEKTPPGPFSPATPLAWLGAFALVVAGLLLFNHSFAPWQRLVAAQKTKPPPVEAADKPLELSGPSTNNFEQNKTWGEVRITDPGMDLKLTKVDVVPLQIEAAANQALRDVRWFSTVNGATETQHPLPPPAEPRYAVFQPTIYLDEYGLSDWDVMTYYARADTEPTNSYASEVYFLEVRPFREDILKMPGGAGGKAYRALSELSGLIGRQQHVIRQTHQHIQRPPEQETLRTQDRKKLAEAEHDLGGAAQHLYAKMAAEMENQSIGDALDNLAKAEKSLESANRHLQNNVMPEAQNQERLALAELIAARKMFQKAVTDDPGAFDEQNPDQEEPPPIAESSRKLKEMAEFRDEAKAAREFVGKTLEQQRDLERRTRAAPLTQYSRLSEQERQLQRSLGDFQEQHPQVFKGTKTESDQAQKLMSKAADTLQNRSGEARTATQQATSALEQLSQAMQDQAAGHQLADAYKLKQMLDRQIQKFDQRSRPDSKMPDEELQSTVKEAKQTVDQLKKTAEQEPTRELFGEPLRDALSGQNKVDLDAKLQKLQAAQDEATKQEAAGEAKQRLANVSKAFSDSEPKALQMARQNDSLKPNDTDSFAQGMAELNNLIRQLEAQRPLSKEDQAKQCREGLMYLQGGMKSRFGDNDRGAQILAELEQMLKAEKPMDIDELKRIMESLQHFSVETSEQLARKEDQPSVMNIDPARLPPVYRGRIQKYFEKLSEK
ncbi:MAG TPA: hypothetical protein VJA21_31930 [Verrucomicrobiae bacterium]